MVDLIDPWLKVFKSDLVSFNEGEALKCCRSHIALYAH